MNNPYYVDLVFWFTLIISGIAAVFLSLILSGYKSTEEKYQMSLKTDTEPDQLLCKQAKGVSILLMLVYCPVLWFFLYNLINFIIYEVLKNG